MENSFKSVTEQSKSLLILLPTKPYFDQVAAALSLYLALRDQKDVTVFSPSPMTVEFNRLIGVNKITQEMGNKNLVIRFTDYKASDIERVSYDIENSQFRLTVIPKQKIAPPTREQIDMSYSGLSVDTVIIIGGANESHFPALASKDLTSANIVHIGTRDITLTSNKTYVSFSRPASSVSEIVADLIQDNEYTLDQDIATNLLMGVEDASNNFTGPEVTAETFAIVANLMKAGGKRSASQNIAQRRDFPAGAIPGGMPRNFPPQNRPQSGVQQVQPQPQPQTQPKNVNPLIEENPEEEEENPPTDWLKPKIYKGTPLS